MNRPPIINQLTLSDPQSRSDCGESCAAMILQGCGIMDTPLEEISDLGHNGVTGEVELSTLFSKAGLTIAPIAAASAPDHLGSGYALMLIHDNGNADPDPAGSFLHWIVAYNLNSNGTVQCANPWGGRDIAYSRSTLAAATIWAIIISKGTSVLVGEKIALVELAFGVIRPEQDLSNPATLSAFYNGVVGWANQIADDGSNAHTIVGDILYSAEGLAMRKTVAALLNSNQGSSSMLIVNTPSEGVWLLSGSMYVHIDDPTVLGSLEATGLKTWTVDEQQHALLVAASAQTIAAKGTVPVTGSLSFGG